MADKTFEELKATGALPSPPGVGMEILRITTNEDCAVDDLARVIQSDPALTGRLLQIANSALSGGARPCTTVKEATMRLGLRSVRSVALGFSLVSAHRNGACATFDYGVFWSHSLARGVAAHVLSTKFRLGIPAEAFVAALVSDIGSLALATVHPRAFAEILATAEARSDNGRAALEQARFGIDHREVAAAMMREWRLPEAFAVAAAALGAVDAPTGDPRRGPTLGTIIWIAARFASAFVIPQDKPHEVERVQKALSHFPDWDPQQLAQLWTATAEGWRKWGNLLEIVTTAVPPFGMGNVRPFKVGSPLLIASAASAARGPVTGSAAPVVATPRVVAKPEAVPASAAATGTTGVPASVVPAESPMTGARILAVDDDPTSLRLLATQLEKAGHTVTRCVDGKEALRTAMLVVPQIVIADWHMPEMSGVDLCRALRQFEAGRRVYIILLTGENDEDQIVEAFDAGLDDYVVKPFKPKLLLARVRAGMRVARMQERIDADKARMQQDAADLGVLSRQLRILSVTDVLTSLPNRRFALDALRDAWDQSVKQDSPLSAVMVDIDKFKRVNDTFGHDVGDLVLKEMAVVLREVVQPPCNVCRIGGEEFVAILPGMDTAAATVTSEKLRGAVEARRIKGGTFDGNVTASFGVATRRPGIRNFEHLLKLADEGLYRAKENGRNQVRVVQDEGPQAQTIPVEPLQPAHI